MPDADYFSTDYEQARERFRQQATRAGFELLRYPIDATGPQGGPLTIDVARKGPLNAARALVVSSGTHGVEGFFGSAVQLAALERTLSSLSAKTCAVLVHAINPYGFAWRRRVNEDNIDLNRNFVLPGAAFGGAPAAYSELDGLLNPRQPPARLEPWLLIAGLKILRHGFSGLKNAVAQGQYEFPHGLFFGGKQPSQSQRIIAQHAREWLGRPGRVLHLDLHTGLGPWGRYVLCSELPNEGARAQNLRREFGAKHVQSYDPKGVLYEIRGGLGRFLEAHFEGTQYDCLLAEFGTYPPLQVLRAMRLENAIHPHSDRYGSHDARAKQALLEVFCPRSVGWRRTVLRRGLTIVDKAALICA